MTAKLPPHSLEVEQSILGTILDAPACASDPLVKQLSVLDFYDQGNKDMFAAVESLLADSKEVNLVSVWERVKKSGSKVPLSTLNATLTKAFPPAFNDLFTDLKTFSIRRQAMQTARRAADLAESGDLEGAAGLLDQARALTVWTASKPVLSEPMKPLVLAAIDRYETAVANQGVAGVNIGFGKFDRTTGGLKPGTMTTIAADTNQGKSTKALNIANNAATNGKGTLLFSLEMNRDEIADILLAMNAGISRNVFNTGKWLEPDMHRILVHTGRLMKFPLWIEDSPTLTAPAIESIATAHAQAGKLDLIIIDYVQIISPTNDRESREQQVAGIARSLRIMAKRLKVPVIILSQLNDEGKLRESRVIAHESHNVIQLEVNEEQTEMTCSVKKGRGIPRFQYRLAFNPATAKLTDNSYPMDDAR